MNAVNLPPASVLRPELRARLERLEHLERRERQGRYARWHVPAPVEREPEGWLLTYLDLITLLLVMLVVMLAFSQPKILEGEPDAVAAASLPASRAAHAQSGNLQASAGTADQTPIASPRAPSSPGNDSSSTLRRPTRAMAEQENDAIDPEARSGMDLQRIPSGPPSFADAQAAVTAGRLPGDPHNTEFDSTTGLAPVAPSDANAQDSGQQPAVGPDRPAPGNVALVGSVRSSPSLQTTLAFSYDLSSVTPAAPAVDMDNATSDPAQLAAPLVSEQATVQLQHGNSHASAQASGSATVAGPGTMPAPSLQDLGLDGLGENIDIIVNEESVSFRINNEILFTSGQADLMPSGLDVLTRLAGVLARNDYQIAVEGHTDPVPIQNERFPSNWELSTGRATSVLRHLQGQGIPASRLRATGYADTKPIAPNDSPAGRSFNRRVELIMEMPRAAPKASQSSSSASAGGAMSLPGSDFSGPIVRLR